MTEAEQWQNEMEEDGTFEYDAPGERTAGTFPVQTVTGDTLYIKEKIAVGDAIVLVTVDGRQMVPSPDDSTYVIDFDPELHVGGTTATGNAGAKMGPSADAAVAADVRAMLDDALMQDGVDATEAAEAKATLEASIAQAAATQPEAIEPDPTAEEPPPATEPDAIPPGEEEKAPPTDEPVIELAPEGTDLASEQPEGSDLKDGPPESEEGMPQPGAGDEVDL